MRRWRVDMPMPPSLSDSDPDLPPPGRPWGRWLGRIAFGMVFGAWSLVLVAWLTLQWGILPNARAWLPQIEQQASRALGLPVRIGDLQVEAAGWMPAVTLTDVVLLDAGAREVLRLPRLSFVPSAWSLPALELRFHQLVVDGASAELRRDAQGRLHVAGFDLGAGTAAALDPGAAGWLLRQHELVLRGARLRWVDEQRGAAPLELSAIDAVLRNQRRRHLLRIDATPPPDWGQRFSLRARLQSPLLGGGADWQRLVGEAYAQFPQFDGAQWRRHLDLPFEWQEGGGALRAWARVERGRLAELSADLALPALTLRLAPGLQPLALREVQGRVSARHDAGALALRAEDFTFSDARGEVWPAADLAVVLRQDGRDPAAPVTGGRIDAERLDLALMAAVADRLPLGAPLRGLLAELRPEGLVEGLHAQWDGALDAPRAYRLRGVGSGLALAAQPAPVGERPVAGRPGLRGARIAFDASERGGQATLAVADGELVLPGVFEQPAVALTRLDARLAWQVEPQPGQPARIALQVSEARFANPDLEGRLQAHWHSGPGEGFGQGGRWPGRIDLSGRIEQARADAVARYLPLAMVPWARDYVARAIRGGRLSDASFVVRGDLWDFPYADPAYGEFRIAGRVSGVDYAYVPDEPGWVSPWPAFAAVGGELEIRGTALTLRNASARIHGVTLSGVQAVIPDLEHAPVLQVEGSARGPLADLLRYVNDSPVGGWIGGALAQTVAGGPAELSLALRIPLTDSMASTVRGTLSLPGNELQLLPTLPALAAARARIDFSEQGFTVRGASARALGGEASIDAEQGRDGVLRVAAHGSASAEGLRATTQIAALASLAHGLEGEAAYRLRVEHGPAPTATLVEVHSDLAGMAITLPAPLAKPAAEPQPLRFAILPQAGEPGRDELLVDLGERLQARYERQAEEGAAQRVLRGGIGLGAPAPRPAQGVAAVATLRELDLAAWAAVFADGQTQGRVPADAVAYAPTQLSLRGERVRAGGRDFSNVVAGVSQTAAGHWRLQASADQFAGHADWRPAAGSVGSLRARLSRLELPAAPEAPAAAAAAPPAAPRQMPAIDLVVERFTLAGHALGRLEIDAVHAAPGDSAAAWRLQRLRLSNPAAVLEASGRWQPAAAGVPARMSGEFGLELADTGALLARFGLPGVMQGGKGRLGGELAWSGSPLEPHLPTLAGRLRLDLGAGRFLKADPGAARLLSVLSLQALPRRLALDFRDVFQEGFAFEDVRGDVSVAAGIARTNNLRLRGLQAAALMEGQTDLHRETQDLRVLVVPEINAGTASLVYAIINPAIGLGSFVAQLFLRQPLMQAGTREFHVTGTWDEPQVERVARAAEAPPPTQ
jgi:uncharacterized protein (TIGR02099 family)